MVRSRLAQVVELRALFEGEKAQVLYSRVTGDIPSYAPVAPHSVSHQSLAQFPVEQRSLPSSAVCGELQASH